LQRPGVRLAARPAPLRLRRVGTERAEHDGHGQVDAGGVRPSTHTI
jgi:hypothetical protein